MPYRDARAPLLQRRDAITRQLAALADELAAVDRGLLELRRRTLPLLDRVTIATPCTASWEHMPGDDRVRSCGECDLEVFDISTMTEWEAEAFLQERLGTKTCVRLHRRADGTIITRDCAVGGRRRRRRLAGSALTIAAAGMALAAAMAPAREGATSRAAPRDIATERLLERLGGITAGTVRVPIERAATEDELQFSQSDKRPTNQVAPK